MKGKYGLKRDNELSNGLNNLIELVNEASISSLVFPQYKRDSLCKLANKTYANPSDNCCIDGLKLKNVYKLLDVITPLANPNNVDLNVYGSARGLMRLLMNHLKSDSILNNYSKKMNLDVGDSEEYKVTQQLVDAKTLSQQIL